MCEFPGSLPRILNRLLVQVVFDVNAIADNGDGF